MVSRRAALFGLSGGFLYSISGCLDGDIGSDPSNDVTMEMSVIEVFGGPEENPIGLKLTRDSSLLSTTELPHLEFELYNESDDEIDLLHSRSLLFSPGESDPSGLTVVTEDEASSIEAEESELIEETTTQCLGLEEPPTRDADETWSTIEPDSSISQRIAIVPLADEFVNDCVEPGSYTMLAPFEFFENSTESADITVDLGFTVEFEEPGD